MKMKKFCCAVVTCIGLSLTCISSFNAAPKRGKMSKEQVTDTLKLRKYIKYKISQFPRTPETILKREKETEELKAKILKENNKIYPFDVHVSIFEEEFWKLFEKNSGDCAVASTCIRSLLNKINVENYKVLIFMGDTGKPDLHEVNIYKDDRMNKWLITDFLTKLYHTELIAIGETYDSYMRKVVQKLGHILACYIFKVEEDGNSKAQDIIDFMNDKEYHFGDYKPELFFALSQGDRYIFSSRDIIEDVCKSQRCKSLNELS